MRSKRDIRLAVSIFIAIAMALILPGLSVAGSLDPPASAVDASGNPVPTMTTPPAWSKKLPASERFEMVFYEKVCLNPPNDCVFFPQAVLDKETGLVWEKSPSIYPDDWYGAQSHCSELEIAKRKGWRVPTLEELASLVETGNNPTLPTGHPFTHVMSDYYWSSTTYDDGVILGAWNVNMHVGGAGYDRKGFYCYVWCVRGGHGYDAY